ncbi:SDR family NAD(P)-dependent oxidoreductase [Actinoplanes utahensis]|uniref:SDR family NAD(P)-dependent oxidoreductase n=1 Tax=Actinoplanes utahensis TaxID=1869 RepID=UPI0005BA4B43|nr:SDR family NAD(P)-dependent oxidoreductase [Actinoplanes utahensis]GIF32116.1 short-chain dehydrogenase [Actinoplanes utahensis]
MTRLPEYRFAGRTAVLTGAASGIGEHLAYGLAFRGSDLVLADIDEGRLKTVADRIRAAHPAVTVQTATVDLADRAAVEALATRILDEHPAIGLLINNAGIALGGRFDQVSVEQFEQVMNVNFRAPMLLTHALLPALTATPGGHLVNLSSLFGLIAPPGQSAYAASKFALRGLSESLRSELIDNGVGVTTVHPGGIATRIAESALVGSLVPEEEVEPNKKLFAALLSYPPDKAAEQILRAVAKRKARLLIAASAKAPDLLARLLPVGHARIVRAFTVATASRGARPAGSVVRR